MVFARQAPLGCGRRPMTSSETARREQTGGSASAEQTIKILGYSP